MEIKQSLDIRMIAIQSLASQHPLSAQAMHIDHHIAIAQGFTFKLQVGIVRCLLIIIPPDHHDAHLRHSTFKAYKPLLGDALCRV